MSLILKLLTHGSKFGLYSSRLPKPLVRLGPISALYRPISTSKKSKDTATLTETLKEQLETEESETGVSTKPKNWVSWGYSITSIEDDNTYMHLMFFCFITVCIVGTTFVLMYQPDHRMVNWTRREAFLELRRREENGLPLIDRDFVPADKIELPSDEELGGIRITI